MDWDSEKLDLLHQLSLTMNPRKMDKEFIRNCLIILTMLSDEETGTELKKLIRQI